MDAVHARATASEGHVARACTGRQSSARLRLQDELTAVALQPVADNSIETKIRNQHECAVGIGDDHVRMRPFLGAAALGDRCPAMDDVGAPDEDAATLDAQGTAFESSLAHERRLFAGRMTSRFTRNWSN